jgi:hypothetical protein
MVRVDGDGEVLFDVWEDIVIEYLSPHFSHSHILFPLIEDKSTSKI